MPEFFAATGLPALTVAGFAALGAAGLAVFLAFLAVLRPLAGETVLVLLSAGLSSLIAAGFVAPGAAGFDFSFLLLEKLFPGAVLLTWGFSTLLAVGVLAVITAEDLLSPGFVTTAVFVVLETACFVVLGGDFLMLVAIMSSKGWL